MYTADATTRSILQTIAYFDIFDYPVTALEVNRFMSAHLSVGETIVILDTLVEQQMLMTRHGFYFFQPRDEIVATRLVRYRQAWYKFAIAQYAVRLLRTIAGVRFIGVCNNTAYHNASVKSDIDVFIIVQQGRLWSARLLITLLMSVLRLRRHGRTVVDRICLSFYVTDQHLDLGDIALKPEDPYLVSWMATLYPLYDDGIYQDFFNGNAWWRALAPQARVVLPTVHRRVLHSRVSQALVRFGERLIGSRFERWAKSLQYGKIQRNTHSALHQHTTSVIVDDTMLKFHETDRRAHYADLWRARCEKLHIS